MRRARIVVLRRRGRQRGLTALEAAIGFALVGSLLAVSVPAFVRNLHASRLSEPVDGLKRIGEAAVAGAQGKGPNEAFPGSAPLTPAVPPRGKPVADPPALWEHPTWKALGFKPAPDGVPHAFSFELDASHDATQAHFSAHAHGDLDGDGTTSSFAIDGVDDARGARVLPGMRVEAELE